MPYPKRHAAASRKYRPALIKLLFIAEAPPALASGRFFYFASVPSGDALFLEMMKVLYPIDAGFWPYPKERRQEFQAKHVRQQKERFLERFKKDGFYLIDAFEQPMPEDANLATKKRMIRSTLPQLRRKVSRLCLHQDVPVILVSNPTYSVCAEALEADGIRVLNAGFVDHPARGGQKQFRRKLREILRRVGIETSDGAA